MESKRRKPQNRTRLLEPPCEISREYDDSNPSIELPSRGSPHEVPLTPEESHPPTVDAFAYRQAEDSEGRTPPMPLEADVHRPELSYQAPGNLNGLFH